jgi:outer membrane lipoprotein SlyB
MTLPTIPFSAPIDERTITIAFSFGAIAAVHKAIDSKTNRRFAVRAPKLKKHGVSKMTHLKKSIGALVLATTAVTGFSAAPAMAREHYNDGYYSRDDRQASYDRRAERAYRNNNYRNNARCDKGTGGTIIGAVAGGLLGNEVARRGNKTEGSIIGAAVGALAGRAIDKADNNCRRYR